MQLENLFPTGRYGSDGRSFVYKPDGSLQYICLATYDGTTWTLTTAGTTLAATADAAGAPIVVGAGTKSGSTVSVAEYGDRVRQSVFTFAATPQTITNGASEFIGTKFYTFPEGRILVLGVTSSLAPTTTSVIATSISSGATGSMGMGTATATNASLTSTMVDLLPATATAHSTTIDVAAAAVKAALAASAQFDGTTTAKDAYLNLSVATGTIDGTVTWSGTATITWISLGDY